MKELSCHDPKMEAYYKTVQHLEDKFDGLELNHVARKYNEAANELAKITASRTAVPPDIFASDLDKASIDYGKLERKGDRPPEPTLGSDPPERTDPPSTPEPEVMCVERLDHDNEPDWRIPYLERLVQGVLPSDQTWARWLT
jgi:hypothetical protein